MIEGFSLKIGFKRFKNMLSKILKSADSCRWHFAIFRVHSSSDSLWGKCLSFELIQSYLETKVALPV